MKQALRKHLFAILVTLLLLNLTAGVSAIALYLQAAPPPANEPFQPVPVAVIEQKDLFDELLRPFAEAAARSRLERAKRDPEYAQRIDAELNKHRLNFLLFGYGETHEPPYEKDTIGSITILSLDQRTHKVTQLSLTHDARAPEIERFMQQKGRAATPSKIDQAYKIGGFELMRLAVENATGLAIDFQLAVEDVVIQHVVDELLGQLEVDSPYELTTIAFYVQGVKHAGGHFPPGKQTLDGLKTMRYLKGINAGPYDAAKENNVRKGIIFKSLREGLSEQAKNPLFAVNMLAWLHNELDRKGIEYDFDLSALLIDTVKELATRAPGGRMTLPTLDQNLYLVDSVSGDGGFEWVTGSLNPTIKDELQRGVYVDKAMVVPRWSANPYAENLPSGYWASVRAVVKQNLAY